MNFTVGKLNVMSHRHVIPVLCAAVLFFGGWSLAAHAQASPAGTGEPDTFSVQHYIPAYGDLWSINRICWNVMREHPEIIIRNLPGIRIENSKGNSEKILAFAGETAPDVLLTHWWTIRNDIRNNFLCPLNEYVGYDGFYGISPETDQRTALTGTRKWRTDPKTGERVPDVNGVIDDDEALWPVWRSFPLMSRIVGSERGRLESGPDGKPYDGPVVYGIPQPQHTYYGIAYRRDLFRKAGLSEEEMPETWDAFWRVCQKLTDPRLEIPGAKFQRGQRAFLLPSPPWQWILWLYAAGGDCIVQAKTNPQTGKTHEFQMEETSFLDPETGETLGSEASQWKAVFAGRGGIEAMRFYQKLVWSPWLVHPQTGEPIDLTPEDMARGSVVDPVSGQSLVFGEGDVIRGVVRHSGDAGDDAYTLFRRGEVAMMMAGVDRLEIMKIPAQNLGFMPIPAGPGGHTLVGYYRHFHSLNALMAGPENKTRRDRGWLILSALTGPEAQRDFVDNKVLQGYARFLTPEQLKIADREEYLDQIPEYWRENYDTFTKRARTEPFMGNWAPASAQIERKVISFLTLKPDFDVAAALIDVEREANERVMFGLPKEVKDRYRPYARVLVPLAGLMFVLCLGVFVRGQLSKAGKSGSVRGVYAWWVPPLMLAPAVVSVLLWSYYPLVRGSTMAFQDYRIGGGTSWVGLDNFITVFFTQDFWGYLMRTFKYVAMALGLGFLTPVITAVLLSEVPRCKTFFRTVYFLPQVSSGLVIMLIWKLLYNPTDFGLLNRALLALNGLPPAAGVAVKLFIVAAGAGLAWLVVRITLIFCDRNAATGQIARRILRLGLIVLALWLLASGNGARFVAWMGTAFNIKAQNWLGDARWAMMAVILPGVWAQAGIGSLIYLAALKSVDEESYEAAEIDGCTFWEKLIYITIPYLKPLIIINFIGAFISTFHAMGNIFAMTGGGPGDETTVLSLAIWYEAFAFMNFGTATAMAWFLGLMLIGFTVFQLKILNKVDFRRAGAE